MGMYNELTGTCKCPYCGSDNSVFEQIKWEGVVRELKHYTVGDTLNYENYVDISDHIVYDYCSEIRPDMFETCSSCGKDYPYTVTVDHGIIISIDPMSDQDKEINIQNMETRLALLKTIKSYAQTTKDDVGLEYFDESISLLPFKFKIFGFKSNVILKYTLLEAIDDLTRRIQTYKGEPVSDYSLFSEYCYTHPMKQKYCPNCNKLVHITANYMGQYCNVCHAKLLDKGVVDI